MPPSPSSASVSYPATAAGPRAAALPARMDAPFVRSVGDIHELLVMIFAHLDERTLSRAARVCQLWSEIALDSLWFEVNDLRKTLNVLAPLVQMQPDRAAAGTRPLNTYMFKRPPTSGDWQRFQRYSRRVRLLCHDHRHMRSPPVDRSKRPVLLHPKVFQDLVDTCPAPDIFPNLQSVTWYPCAPDRQPLCLVFIHRRVRHLALHLYRSQSSSLSDFLRELRSRCSNVTSLELCSQEPMGQYENDVPILLQGLSHLSNISVPIYGLTPRFLTELSRLKYVATISLSHPARAEPGNRADVAHFQPVFRDDAFPALCNLSFSAQVADGTRLLLNSRFPGRLTALHFKSIVTATGSALQGFFCAVRDGCTSLIELSVDYIIAPDSPLPPPSPVHERPSIETFRPLFHAQSLRVFELRWDYALNLSDADMDEFARGWPSLESLQLNSEPVPEANGPGLTLRALLPFARHCPNIRYLGLYIDARSVPSLAPHVHDRNVPHFNRLRSLAVGLSALRDVEPVVLFLSQLLPLECTLRCGLRWPDAFDIAMEHALVPVSIREEMLACYKRWETVGRLLPVAKKARMEEKVRFDVLERQMMALELSRREDKQKLTWLEREVQDLRGRTGRTP